MWGEGGIRTGGTGFCLVSSKRPRIQANQQRDVRGGVEAWVGGEAREEGERSKGGEGGCLSLPITNYKPARSKRLSPLPQCPKVGALHLGPINQVFSFL